MRKGKVRRISSDLPEARDEGPRLLPLEKEHPAESRLDYYLALADRSLNAVLEKPETRKGGTQRKLDSQSKPGAKKAKPR
jgi:hypothetical protein